MKKFTYLFLLLSISLSTTNVFAQVFNTIDYKKAEWMTARFYGAQRSSLKTGKTTNWLLQNHGEATDFNNDNDNGYDLTGGWFDCGDHPMFGQTQFYSAYILLKSYDVWPAGFGDYYSQDYAGYYKTQNYNWEGGSHDPDGIPDILNEVKYATDFFIKAARSETMFYSQKGQGAADHKHWITSVKMATLATDQGGQDRVMYSNVKDASMASFCSATLALMSRKYRSIDPKYADTCLKHALYAYTFAKNNKAVAGSPEGAFYGANAKWQDDYASMCTELYYATNDEAYKTEALSFETNISNHYYCFGYNNNDDIAAYNLATLGSTQSASLLNSFANQYKSQVNANGLFIGGDATWGTLRYNANSALVVALNSAFTKSTGVDPFIYKQVDYILGNNTAGADGTGLSFVVGFGPNSVKYPHHRNVYLSDADAGNASILTIPARNAQFGYLAGGIRSGTYADKRDSYETAEGGIDYSAGLVGVLGYILSQTASEKPDTMYLSPKPFTVSLSNSWPITLNFEPAKSYTDVNWTSRDTTIAKVASNGVVSGLALGKTYIIAQSFDGKFIDSTECTVSIINVTGVSIPAINTIVGSSTQLIAAVVPANASNRKVTWESSDPLIASISSSGIVSTLAVGTATITVKTVDGSFTSQSIVTASPNPNMIVAKKTEVLPVIDGNLNDGVWDLNKTITKIASGTKNNTESFGVLWDETYLYLGVKVIDSKIVTSNSNAWDNDGIELYFDMNHNGGTYDASDRQWIKVLNSTNIWQKIGAIGGAVTTSSSVKSASQLNADGYSIELAIPWTILGVTPNTTDLYGFDIAVDDCDGSTTRDNQVMWVGTGDNYKDLSKIGIIQLSNTLAEYVPTAIETIEKVGISIYPNPAKSSFTIKNAEQTEMKVIVLDTFGRELQYQVGAGELNFDCSKFQTGVYYVRVESQNHVTTQSIIIEN